MPIFSWSPIFYQILLDADGTEIDSSTKPAEEEGQDDVITPAIFTLGKGMIIPGKPNLYQSHCIRFWVTLNRVHLGRGIRKGIFGICGQRQSRSAFEHAQLHCPAYRILRH